MADEDIRQYLNRQGNTAPVRGGRIVAKRKAQTSETFKNFSATHLLCPTCKRAMPVRERVLLFLPTGNLYDYCCTACGTSVGTKKG